VETDDVFSTYGITYDEKDPTKSIEALKAVLVQKGVYPDAKTDNNYKDPSNIIYQFVAYHLLKERVPYNHLAIHYNEFGYNNGAYSINTWEYYETFGPWRRLMKITSGPRTGGYRINRYQIYNLNTYKETSVPREGVLVSRRQRQA
jgi:Ni/Co efflux regulator RcnB